MSSASLFHLQLAHKDFAVENRLHLWFPNQLFGMAEFDRAAILNIAFHTDYMPNNTCTDLLNS